MNFHGRTLGDRAFHGAATEQQGEYARYEPFESQHPCRCGSRGRVWNLRGQVFCQKCGRAHEASRKRFFLGVQV